MDFGVLPADCRCCSFLNRAAFGGTYLGNLHTAQAWQVHAKQTEKGMWLPIMDVDALHSVTSSEQKAYLQSPTQLQM